jgi:hypothetical protein
MRRLFSKLLAVAGSGLVLTASAPTKALPELKGDSARKNLMLHLVSHGFKCERTSGWADDDPQVFVDLTFCSAKGHAIWNADGSLTPTCKDWGSNWNTVVLMSSLTTDTNTGNGRSFKRLIKFDINGCGSDRTLRNLAGL